MENNQVNITQSVAILIDGNNIEMSLHSLTKDQSSMINFDTVIPKLLRGRGLSRLIYFREGNHISSKLAERLLNNFMGSVVPCHKSADIPLSISATQIARKVDTIIVLSGDSDYIELVRHLKGEGVRVEIAAVKQTTAGILIEEADHFVALDIEDSFSLNTKKRRYPTKKAPAPTAKDKAIKTTKVTSKKAPAKKTNKKVVKPKAPPNNKNAAKSNGTKKASGTKRTSNNRKKPNTSSQKKTTRRKR